MDNGESVLDHEGLPGREIVVAGLRDLERGEMSIEALLVLIGAPRLTRLGLTIPAADVHMPEHALYDRLAAEHGDAAHSKYNALIRRLVSFERAAECAAGPTRS